MKFSRQRRAPRQTAKQYHIVVNENIVCCFSFFPVFSSIFFFRTECDSEYGPPRRLLIRSCGHRSFPSVAPQRKIKSQLYVRALEIRFGCIQTKIICESNNFFYKRRDAIISDQCCKIGVNDREKRGNVRVLGSSSYVHARGDPIDNSRSVRNVTAKLIRVLVISFVCRPLPRSHLVQRCGRV